MGHSNLSLLVTEYKFNTTNVGMTNDKFWDHFMSKYTPPPQDKMLSQGNPSLDNENRELWLNYIFSNDFISHQSFVNHYYTMTTREWPHPARDIHKHYDSHNNPKRKTSSIHPTLEDKNRELQCKFFNCSFIRDKLNKSCAKTNTFRKPGQTTHTQPLLKAKLIMKRTPWK